MSMASTLNSLLNAVMTADAMVEENNINSDNRYLYGIISSMAILKVTRSVEVASTKPTTHAEMIHLSDVHKSNRGSHGLINLLYMYSKNETTDEGKKLGQDAAVYSVSLGPKPMESVLP